MFVTIFDKLTASLNQRFMMNALLPALVFALGLLVVLLAAGPGLGTASAWWEALDGYSQAGLTILAVTAIYFLAVLLASQWQLIVRIFQGESVARVITRRRTSFHQTRAATLHAADEPSAADYPVDPGEVRPTLLGNILSASEEYADRAYGANAALTWPRLYELLPKESLDRLGSTRSSMEGMLVYAALTALTGTVAGVVLAATNQPLWVALLAPIAGLVAMVAFYGGCLNHARSYGELLRTAYDLHRHELLKAFRLEPPSTLRAERVSWFFVAALLDGQIDQGFVFSSGEEDDD